MDLSRALSAGLIALAALAGGALEARAQCPPTVPNPLIGPGTPCEACWTNPTLDATGAPLTALLTTVHVYLDPPAGGPVIGTTPVAITAPISSGVAGAPASLPLCPGFAVLPSSGPHTLSVSVLIAGGEGPGSSPPVPFTFQALAPARGTLVGYQ